MAVNKNKFGNTGNLVHALGSFEKSMKPLFSNLSKSIETLNDNISELGNKVERPVSPRGTNGQNETNGIKDSINDLNVSIEKLTEAIEKGGKGGSGGGSIGGGWIENDKGERFRFRGGGSGHYNYNLERLKRGDLGKDPIATVGNATIEKIKDSIRGLDRMFSKTKGSTTAVKSATSGARGATTISEGASMGGAAAEGAVAEGAVAGGEAAAMGGMAAGATAAGPFAAIVIGLEAAIDIAEFAISKYTEYMRLEYENAMRALEAITTETTNTMQASLALWQNALSGAYEAQNLAMQSNLALIQAENASALASKKLADSWWKWVPVYGQWLEKVETEMEMRQKMQESMVKSAMEIIQRGEGYSKQVDEYLSKQDDAVRRYTRSVGLTTDQTRAFELRMISLDKSFAAIGRTADEVLKIQTAIQEQSGRIINFSDKDYERAGAVGKIMGDQNFAQFQSEMVLFNQSVADSADIMQGMYNYANRMGLSQQKLTKTVLNNLKLAEKYQFKGGIKGFIDFSKWAENVRFNVAQLGNMIEKIQTGGLEGVIKQAAQVQVLGGNFAMHADPLRMAYNAFMDPEELAKNFYDSLKAEGVFDTKTGELYQGAGNQMRVRAYSEAMGYSFEDTKTMLREQTKRENINKQLANSRFTEEQKQAIANGAQRDEKTGEWYVNTLKGARVNVADLESQGVKMSDIRSGDTNTQLVDYAARTLSATETIAATTTYIGSVLGGQTLDKFLETTNAIAEITRTGFEENADEVTSTYEQVQEHNIEAAKEAVANLSGLGQKMTEAYGKIAEVDGYAKSIDDLLRLRYAKENAKLQKERDDADKKVQAAKEAYEQGEANGGASYSQKKAYQEALKEWGEAYGNYAMVDMAKNTGSKWQNWAAGGAMSLATLFSTGNIPLSLLTGVSTGLTTKQLRQSDISKDFDDMVKGYNNATNADDATIDSGSSVVIPSSKVTPINDGATEFAKTNPNDSAIFAKTGGPFDKLFDGIFGRIDAVYNAVMPREKSISDLERGLQEQNIRNYTSSVFSNPVANNVRSMMARPIGSDMVGTVREYSGATGGDIAQTNTNTSIDFKPIRLEINGRLDIAGGGANMNIMQELKKDPFFIRSLTQLISNSLSEKVNGGKALYNGGNLTYL